MLRITLTVAILALLPSLSQARDDGGFGASFTNASPSALVDGAPPALAQLGPDASPTATDLQNIMPAAGEEQPEAVNAPDVQNAEQPADTAAPTPEPAQQQ